MDLEILENIGLSKREAKVYLALIELGSTTVGDVVKRTEIPSSKIYEVLDRLIEKGFASYVIIKNQKHFQPSDPETITRYLDEKKQQFERIIPVLKEKQRYAKEKQEVELYEGKEAVFKVLRNLVSKAKEEDEYFSFSMGKEHANAEFSLFLENLGHRRLEKKLVTRIISQERYRGTIERRYEKEMLKKLKNKYTNIEFPQGIVVLNNDVVFIEWDEHPTAVRITSRKMAENHKKFFFSLYENAKE